jgi:hypothetical protein
MRPIDPNQPREPNREQIGGLLRRVGIPTLLDGVQFRSRIEATWAAFFASANIPWNYEPTDLDGWIPDFDLEFKKRPLLVEVKALQEDIDLAKSKIECAGWGGEIAIIVDATTAVIGEIYEPGFGWDRCVVAWCLHCKVPTLCSESGRWLCRTCGGGQGCLWFGWSPRQHWDGAKNIVQWRRPV